MLSLLNPCNFAHELHLKYLVGPLFMVSSTFKM